MLWSFKYFPHELSRRSVVVLFFQAEDGIRDIGVTGVQTCALPISATVVGCLPLKTNPPPEKVRQAGERHEPPAYDVWGRAVSKVEADRLMQTAEGRERSEERRAGEEW